MRVQRVYVDTSVTGGCFDAEFAPWSNGIFDDFRGGTLQPLADTYRERKILTPKFYADGLHIALATTAEVDVLVSWNFKHIVHYQKIRHFNAVHLELGYKPLQIYSPREVTYHGDGEDAGRGRDDAPDTG